MRQRTIWLSIVLCAGAMSCASKSFVRADPPATAEGVQVALVSEECAMDQDPVQADTFQLDLALTMQLTDGAGDAVKFHPERSRLIVAGRETLSDDRAEEIGVGAGSKKSVHVHFLVKGRDVACNNVMSVALDKAVDLGQKPIHLSPLSFQPSNAPDS